jgi:class 3 adenylate cyclase/HAMP domain-containing protein
MKPWTSPSDPRPLLRLATLSRRASDRGGSAASAPRGWGKFALLRWSRSLTARLLGYFSLLSLITVALVGVVAFLRARDALKRSVFERLSVIADLKQDALAVWIDGERHATVALARVPSILSQLDVLWTEPVTSPEYRAAYARLSQYLVYVSTSRPELAEICILSDVDGKVIFSTNKAHEGEYRDQDRYFTEGRRGTFIQNVYASPSTREPTMTIATPLFDQVGRQQGVLAAHLQLEKMSRIILERTGLGQGGEIYMVDRSGVFLSGGRAFRGEFERGAHSAGIDAAVRGMDGAGLYRNYRGVPVLGVFRWIEQREIALLVEVQQSQAFAPASQMVVTIVMVGLTSAGLLMVGVYLIARAIARPILAITRTATKVADGDLSHTAPVLSEDEIGVLAGAFNKMTEQLRLLYAGLEAKVAELSRTEDALRGSLVELYEEQQKSEALLLNVLPSAIAERLKTGHRTIAESFSEVTVMFADIVDFSGLAAQATPAELVELLNTIFSRFDHLTETHGLEKIKTIGDAYMAVGGLPTPRPDHAEAVADLALALREEIGHFKRHDGTSFCIRIGINTGPVVAGVIGVRKFIYDLWGDTVNVASRMEAHGLAGSIQVTEATYARLSETHMFEKRGSVTIKGRGEMTTYWLIGRREPRDRDPRSA